MMGPFYWNDHEEDLKFVARIKLRMILVCSHHYKYDVGQMQSQWVALLQEQEDEERNEVGVLILIDKKLQCTVF